MQSNIIPEDAHSQSRAIRASVNVSKSFENVYVQNVNTDSVIPTSLSPFIIDAPTLRDMATIHDAIVKGIRSAVDMWSKNERIRKIISLHPRIERVLLMTSGYEYQIGTLRPDVLFHKSGIIQVCEINARFPLNIFITAALANEGLHKVSMNPHSIYAELGVAAVGAGLRFLGDLKKRLSLGPGSVLWLLYKKEPEIDAAKWASSLGVTVRHCPPARLTCNGNPLNGVYCREEDGSLTKIYSCLLKLHQEEYLLLDDGTLEALARMSYEGRALNDFRTIFLAHDKRMLYLLQSGILDVDDETQRALKRYLVPTFPTTLSRGDFFDLGFESYVLKPCLLGNAEGISLQKNMSADEFFFKVEKAGASGSHIVQAYVMQGQYDILNNKGEVERMNVVGTLDSMDGNYYGPGLFRSGTRDLVSLRRYGIASYPACHIKTCPPGTRSFARNLLEANFLAIRRSLSIHGVALLGVGSPLGCKHELRAFLVDGLCAKIRRTEHDEGDVSDMGASANFSVEDALSQVSLKIQMRTDCSFEQNPPRFVALSVVHSDRFGGGRLCISRISDVVEGLDEETVHDLKTLCPRWIVPAEFKTPGVNDVVEPVLVSNSHGRFQRKLCTKHLTREDSTKFWRAFSIFFIALQKHSVQNEVPMPEQFVIILDNQRFAYAVSPMLHFQSHMHRVRFDIEGFEQAIFTSTH